MRGVESFDTAFPTETHAMTNTRPKRNRLPFFSFLATCFVIAVATRAADVPKSPQEWFEAGRAAAQANKQQTPNTHKAKNVILFIGDGMGISTVTAARILEGQQRGVDGEYNRLSFERFPYSAFSVTASANEQTSDSAPTATALVTGVKTNDGAISEDQTVQHEERDAATSASKSLLTILERAEKKGLSTGVVTTTRVTHATPAANYAHVSDRDWEADSDLPKGATVKDIARQLIEFPYGNGIEVVLGGGRSNFLPKTQADPEYGSQLGRRSDGRDLTHEWTARYPSAAYVWNQKDFDAIDVAHTDHLLGLFQPSHMRYDVDRKLDASGEPSLAAMTAKAIDVLKKNKKGFYLMVEGGRIDHGHHAGNAYRALTDAIALSEAVKKAREMTNEQDTLIIVTADHSHTLVITGYPSRGNPILGKAAVDGQLLKDKDGLPYTTLSYANGPGAITDGVRYEFDADSERLRKSTNTGIARRPDLTNIDTTSPGYQQESLVPLSAESHGGEDVPIYASGPHAYLFHGTVEQNVVYHVMAEALGFKD
jgi:alkaline phosphatase